MIADDPPGAPSGYRETADPAAGPVAAIGQPGGDRACGPAGIRVIDGQSVVCSGGGADREGVAVEARLPLENTDALTGVEMFSGLEPEARRRVIAAAVPYTYRKGQVLFSQDDPGDSLIVLKRGAVAVYRTSPAGERALLTVVRPPDVFGEVSLLDGSARSASAEAIEDCSVLALSRVAFLELVHSNPAILDAVMRSLGGLIRRLTEQNADHVFLDLPGRVAKALVRLAGDSQASMVTIELNQSQLAEMAG